MDQATNKWQELKNYALSGPVRQGIDTRIVVPQPPDNTKIIQTIPKEVLAYINDFLSLYDCVKLSRAAHYFHSLFFTLALRSDYKLYLDKPDLPKPTTFVDELFLYTAKVTQAIISQPDNQPERPVTEEERIFNNYTLARKSKFLMYDETGQDRLKQSGLDSPLIKAKIANGDLTAEQALKNKADVMEIINEELDANHPAAVKECLRSPVVQECLIVGLLDIHKDQIIIDNPSIRLFLEHPRVQEALRHNEINRKHILQFTNEVLVVLKDPDVLSLMDKKLVTLQDVIQYPGQVSFIAEQRYLMDALCAHEITWQQIFALDQDQRNFLRIYKIETLIESQVRFNIQNNIPLEERGKKTARILEFSKNPQAREMLNLSWINSALKLTRENFKPLENALMRADLLLEIEAKHGNFKYESQSYKGKGLEAYFFVVWGEYKSDEDYYPRLDGNRCLTAEPETLRYLVSPAKFPIPSINKVFHQKIDTKNSLKCV